MAIKEWSQKDVPAGRVPELIHSSDKTDVIAQHSQPRPHNGKIDQFRCVCRAEAVLVEQVANHPIDQSGETKLWVAVDLNI